MTGSGKAAARPHAPEGLKKFPKRKDTMFMQCFDKDGEKTIDVAIQQDKWYKDLHPAIISPAYRLKHGIVKITMQLYGREGYLRQNIFHDYSPETGEYAYGECRHIHGWISKI